MQYPNRPGNSIAAAALLLFATQAPAGPGTRGAATPALHFAHPLIAESPTPDTKVRFDHQFENRAGDEGVANTVRLEAEYAWSRAWSVEIDIPYTIVALDDAPAADHLDTIEVGLKHARFEWAERGLVIGGGLEFGLPTGNEEVSIGSDHVVEIEPFLDFGLARDDWELVGFVKPGFPLNENGEDEADVELGWNLALTLRPQGPWSGILELAGEHAMGGEEDGFDAVSLTPGLRWRRPGEALELGFGVRLPLTDDKEFHFATIASAFFHLH